MANIIRLTGTTAETMIATGRTTLLALIPDATTTGTVTVRDTVAAVAGPVDSISAIGLTQTGKQFGPTGIMCSSGLSVQLSVGTDAVVVVWSPA